MNTARAHSGELVAALTVILLLFAPALEPVQLAAVSVMALAILLVSSRDRARGLLALFMASAAAAVIVLVRVIATGR